MLKKFHRIAGKVRKEACEETEEEGAGAKRARRFEKFNKSCGFGANNFAPNGSVQDAKIRDQEPRTRTSAWKPRGFFFFFFLSHRFCRSLEIRLADLIFIFPTESFFCRGERFARIGIDFDHGNLRNFVMDKKRTDEYSGRSDDKSEKIERPRNHDRRR